MRIFSIKCIQYVFACLSTAMPLQYFLSMLYSINAKNSAPSTPEIINSSTDAIEMLSMCNISDGLKCAFLFAFACRKKQHETIELDNGRRPHHSTCWMCVRRIIMKNIVDKIKTFFHAASTFSYCCQHEWSNEILNRYCCHYF